VTIRAPNANVKDAEIAYEERTFLFSSKPYFLRLHLPREVIDDETGSADYDCDKGVFTIRVPKKAKGVHFPNLEMLSELLKPTESKEVGAQRLVEEVPDEDEEEATISDDCLFANQEISSEPETDICDAVCTKFGYGFGWLRHGVLGKFQDELGEMIDLREMEDTPINERAELCRLFDVERFKEEHYLADLYALDDGLLAAIDFKADLQTHLSLNDSDREQLKDLKVRVLPPLSPSTNRALGFSLLDILLAFLYDLRVTEAEHCVESGWNIAKLSPSLSFLVRWESGEEAVMGFLRRSLVYPLFRNWELSMQVVKDLERVLEAGRPSILHCLLQVRPIFNSSGGEFRYLLNQLFIDDFCLWIQQAGQQSLIDSMREELHKTIRRLSKESVGLDLELIEAEAGLKAMKVEES